MEMLRFTISIIILYKSCSTPEVISQPHHFVSARLGDSVTLECYAQTSIKVTTWIWLKHTMGLKLRPIIKTYYEKEELVGEFENETRFKVKRDSKSCNLTLWNIVPSDTAYYHCEVHQFTDIYYGNTTFLMIKEEHSKTVIQQPVSEPLQQGDSVTLQCSIHTETCAGEHSVYWFRQASGESLPGIIYTHGNRSDQCERSSGAGSPTQSCVYKLPKRNLSRSDAGTYYCAVATCGEILFGNGTKLDFE
ncbi:hypothetical protein JZ751_006948, partial [Albula glossodonta]